MRILYVQQHFATPSGDAGLRGYNLTRIMAEQGHDVTVITGENWRDPSLRARRRTIRTTEARDGVRVVTLGVPYSNALGKFSRIASFLSFAVLASWECIVRPGDLVYASSTPLTVTVPAFAARVFRRRRYVLEIRDLWPEIPIALGALRNPMAIRFLRFWERAAYRHAMAGVGLAPAVTEAISTIGGLPPDRVFLVPNGSDTRGTTPRRRSIPRLRPRLGVDENATVFAYTGTIGVANGIDAILDAAGELERRRERGIAIVIVGNGKERARLETRAATEGLTSVRFVDFVAKDGYADALGEVDVGLQTLIPIPEFAYGTSPQKFFDYLAAGLPMIVNYPGWMSDLVTDHGCGRAIRARDPAALAEAMIELRDDEPGRARMGERARATAESEFDQWTLLPELVRSITSLATADTGASR